MGTVGITLDDGRRLKLSETLCEALKSAEDDGSGGLRLSVEVPEPVYIALKRRGLAKWQWPRGVLLTPLGTEVCRHLGGPLDPADVPEAEPTGFDVPNSVDFGGRRSSARLRKLERAEAAAGKRETELPRRPPFRSRRRSVVWGRRPEAAKALEEAELAQAPPMVGAEERPRPVVDAALSRRQARRLSLALEQRELLLHRFHQEPSPWWPFTRLRREQELARRSAGPQWIIDLHRGRYVEPRNLNDSGRWTLGRAQSASNRVLRSSLVRKGRVDRELNRALVAETEWAVARDLQDRQGGVSWTPWWDVALVDPLEVRIRVLEGYVHRLTEVDRWSAHGQKRLPTSTEEELEFLVRRALWVGRQIDDRALGMDLDILTDRIRAGAAAYPHHDAWLIDLLNERPRPEPGI